MDTSKTENKKFKDLLYETIFEADTPAGKIFDMGLLAVIILSTLTVMIESIPEIPLTYIGLFIKLEWFFTIIFTLEYAARIFAVRYKKKYITSFFGIVDLISILPTYLALIFSGAQVLLVIRTLRLLRIFRILKLVQFIGAAQTLRSAIFASRHKIFVFLITISISVIIFGTIMFMIEGRENGFTSIPRSIYWAIVTMTTVGYGDIAPQTYAGQIIASVIMIMGYGIIAVPTGIVSAEMVFQKRRGDLTTQVCPICLREGHDMDAEYCKYCGGNLHQ